MPDIRVKEQHGDQITYIILDDVQHTKIFPQMLANLDENKEKYRIKSYGLSNSSLEQVFLRVADEVKRPEDYKRSSRWKRFKNRIKQCCRKKSDKKEENPTETTQEEEEEGDQQDDNDQEQFNTGLSGKINNSIDQKIYTNF
jgi:hypothetical protein